MSSNRRPYHWAVRVTVGLAPLLSLAACSFEGTGAVAAIDASLQPVDARADGARPDATALALVDSGLVVRYFIDEAGSGQAPIELVDSAPEPLNLPITYGQAVYVDDGNRGLYWAATLGDGKVERALPAPKVTARLQDALRITMEVVVDIDAADLATACQITGLRGLNPDFMLAAIGSDLRVHKPFGPVAASWADINEQERMVLHIVFDATQAAGDRRIDLYKNGVLVPKTTSTPPDLNVSLNLGNNDDLMIGNRQNEDQSISGTIYYVAYYDQPLTVSEIANNAQRLFANDDQ